MKAVALVAAAFAAFAGFAEGPWYHELLNVPAMHKLGITGKGVKVGVVDSGNHLHSVVSIIKSREFGIAPDCELMSVDTSGSIKTDVPRTIKALWKCATNGCRVINMSFGYMPGLYSDEHLRMIDEAVVEIHRKTSVIFISSMGNNNFNELPYHPQDLDIPICIGGIDRDLKPGDLTDSWRKDFCAFGIDVPAAVNGSGKTGKVSGTSFAAPMATALVALLLQQEPSLTRDEVYEIFKRTAKRLSPDRSREYGWGLLQACKVPKDYRCQSAIDAEKARHVKLARAEILNPECRLTEKGLYDITLGDGESIVLKTKSYPAEASDPRIYWYRGNKLFLNPIGLDQKLTAVTFHETSAMINDKPMKFQRGNCATYEAYNSDYERLFMLRVNFKDAPPHP